ncbi:MAG: hypothetical protein ACOC1X_00660 [Promethearchaeota archaeon]
MTYELFEGKKVVRKPKIKKDKEFFEEALEKLSFKKFQEIDLVTFCAAIGLYKEYKGENVVFEEPKLKELAKMYSFKKADLYDNIVLNFLEIDSNRLEVFEKYFYAGFKILEEWFEDYGPESKCELERFSKLWDYLVGDEHNECL